MAPGGGSPRAAARADPLTAPGHDRLDDLPDWIAATLDPLEGAGPGGADCVAASVGGMLAAEAVLEPIGA